MEGLVIHSYGKCIILLIIDANEGILESNATAPHSLHHFLLGL